MTVARAEAERAVAQPDPSRKAEQEAEANRMMKALQQKHIPDTVATYTVANSWTPANVSQSYTPATAFNAAALTNVRR